MMADVDTDCQFNDPIGILVSFTWQVAPVPLDKPDLTQLRREAALGGLIHDYRLVA